MTISTAKLSSDTTVIHTSDLTLFTQLKDGAVTSFSARKHAVAAIDGSLINLADCRRVRNLRFLVIPQYSLCDQCAGAAVPNGPCLPNTPYSDDILPPYQQTKTDLFHET